MTRHFIFNYKLFLLVPFKYVLDTQLQIARILELPEQGILVTEVVVPLEGADPVVGKGILEVEAVPVAVTGVVAAVLPDEDVVPAVFLGIAERLGQEEGHECLHLVGRLVIEIENVAYL